MRKMRSLGLFLATVVVATVAAAGIGAFAPLGLPLPATPQDFLQPGTQPESLDDPIFASTDCRDCHGNYNLEEEPYGRWAGSMMAQSTRDPIFHAALAIANQDVSGAGELCLRCHSPVGWLGGRSDPPDGSGLDPTKGDFDGITCHVCHRLVDPIVADENPPEDEGILADLILPPRSEPHSAQYVIDPADRRRGPFDLGFGFPWHQWRQSPFHREALLCSNCHDVSNPALSKQPDGTYKLNELDTPHETHRKGDEFPVERTFTEWKHSVYGRAAIDAGGRFGGNKAEVSVCQDCHMPDTTGTACKPGVGGTLRDDMPLHDFNGANSWVVKGVRSLYPDAETGLTDEIVEDALGRNRSMLERAADLEAFRRGPDLVVRVINRTGHKLPTGYGEGRRMWLNVQFLDAGGQVVEERGHYDPATALLTADDTRVYEVHQGLDAYMAELTGVPPGPSFHFVLNNAILKDNRVPPRGFTNAVYDAAQAGAVDHAYADEHFWDETVFAIPAGTAKVRVRLFHQTTSREYIEFLRAENQTNDKGQVAYDVWAEHGKSEPVLMGSVELTPGTPVCPTPIVYGLGKVGSNGERARVGWTGTPSVAADDFQVTLADAVPGKPGALIGGLRSASRPFNGGTLLIEEPKVLQRFTVGGDGTAVVPLPLGDKPGMVGREIYLQVVFADPFDGDDVSLSDALHVDICE